MESPFCDAVMEATLGIFQEFFALKGTNPSLEILPGQPFRFHSLYPLALIMEGPDFIAHLVSGVDLGHRSRVQLHKILMTQPFIFLRIDNQLMQIKKYCLSLCAGNRGWFGWGNWFFRGSQAEIWGQAGNRKIRKCQPTTRQTETRPGQHYLNPISRQATQEKCSYPKLQNMRQCVSLQILELGY